MKSSSHSGNYDAQERKKRMRASNKEERGHGSAQRCQHRQLLLSTASTFVFIEASKGIDGLLLVATRKQTSMAPRRSKATLSCSCPSSSLHLNDSVFERHNESVRYARLGAVLGKKWDELAEMRRKAHDLEGRASQRTHRARVRQ